MRNNEISRRDFLTMSVGAVAAFYLAGCKASPTQNYDNTVSEFPTTTPQPEFEHSPLPEERATSCEGIDLSPEEYCGNKEDGWRVKTSSGREVNLPGHINPAEYIHNNP
ncbi:MAG: twin-arginine translocation signal domain-containing protein [Patescibacteria group bacterium]